MEQCVNWTKHLTSPRDGETVSTALGRAFTGTNLSTRYSGIQVSESGFASRLADFEGGVNLGCGQLYSHAVRHFLDMLKEPDARDRPALSSAKADPAIPPAFADLASRLDFDTLDIRELNSISTDWSGTKGLRDRALCS